MVQSMWVENNHWNTLPEQIMTNVSGEKRQIKSEECEQESPVNKRCKSSSSQEAYESDVEINNFVVSLSIDEPSPLGLRMTKTPSFVELIQSRLSQGNKNNVVSPNKNIQSGNKKYAKSKAATSGPIEKLKASNFPALLLRIGKWEYVSKHEGDLVGKCYFAKHKIVWEVLDDGLKNKIEIQWSDIVGLKASCPDNGPGVLTIVLREKPLFFRETDPQPRKHTLWQTTSDFTDGEASIYRQHYLECAPGVLNKHYEKLLQCDTRLNCLSQQSDIVLDLPFVAKASIEDQNVVNNNGYNQLEISGLEGSNISGQVNQPRVHQSVDHIGHYIPENNPGHVLPFSESLGLEGSNNIGQQVNYPSVQQTTSISDHVNHINQNNMLDNISQILLNDKELTTRFDEKNLKSRVNSLWDLIGDGNDYCTPDPGMNYINNWNDGNDYFMQDCNMVPQNADFGMSHEDSYNNMLHQLPKIESLPNLSGDSYPKII